MKNLLNLFALPVLVIVGILSSFTFMAVAQQSASVSSLGEVDCVIYPSAQAELGSSVPGVLLEIPVDRSDPVEKGQVLAILESSAERAAVELARARAEASSEVNFRRIGADHSVRQLNRVEELYRQNSISKQDLDDRKTEARLGQIQLKQAQENQHILALELVRAQTLLDRKTIRSPFDGVVVERFKIAGEYVDDQPVLRIAQLDPLHVETIVPAEYARTISTGMTARIWSEATPGVTWTARVDRVDAMIDVASGTFGVRLVLPNADKGILAGLRCKLEFNKPAAESAHSDIQSSRADTQMSPVSQSVPEPPLGAALPAVNKSISDDPTSQTLVTALGTESLVTDAAINALAGCLEPGPYPDLASVKKAVRASPYELNQLKIVEKVLEKPIGHLVKSKSLNTEEQIQAYVSALTNAGISDFLVPTSAPPIRVSLGAFKQADSARSLVSSLNQREIQAELLPWVTATTEYVLEETSVSQSEWLLCD